jgi:CubicO group peptidase (beta-lactamase class C family)
VAERPSEPSGAGVANLPTDRPATDADGVSPEVDQTPYGCGVSGEAFSGVCLVVQPGQRFERTSGKADRATSRAWTVHTQSQVASISKQFVAACALILVERGAIELGDPVRRHLPVAGPAWDEVSVQHLLTHTSAISHWGDQPGFDASTPTPADERLRLFLDAPRSGRPGETFRYSSPGYLVLSAVLAAAAGRPYEELARELVLTPLGLNKTHLGAPGPGPVALGYREGETVASWDLGSMPGTGDVWSTAVDLARFVSALHSGGLLPPAAHSLLHEVAVPTPVSSSDTRIRADGYAAGHFVGTVDGQPAYVHPGDNPGYQSLALWLPESSTAVVVLSNEETADLESTAADMLQSAH